MMGAVDVFLLGSGFEKDEGRLIRGAFCSARRTLACSRLVSRHGLMQDARFGRRRQLLFPGAAGDGTVCAVGTRDGESALVKR